MKTWLEEDKKKQTSPAKLSTLTPELATQPSSPDPKLNSRRNIGTNMPSVPRTPVLRSKVINEAKTTTRPHRTVPRPLVESEPHRFATDGFLPYVQVSVTLFRFWITIVSIFGYYSLCCWSSIAYMEVDAAQAGVGPSYFGDLWGSKEERKMNVPVNFRVKTSLLSS